MLNLKDVEIVAEAIADALHQERADLGEVGAYELYATIKSPGEHLNNRIDDTPEPVLWGWDLCVCHDGKRSGHFTVAFGTAETPYQAIAEAASQGEKLKHAIESEGLEPTGCDHQAIWDGYFRR